MAKIEISSFWQCYKSFGGVNLDDFVGISEKKIPTLRSGEISNFRRKIQRFKNLSRTKQGSEISVDGVRFLFDMSVLKL